MENNNEDYFWPSYVDLLTSIFFVMLVLFVVSFFLLTKEKERLRISEEDMRAKLQFIEDVEKTLEGLKKDTTIFMYEKEFKRYKLVQKVEFNADMFEIDYYSVKNYFETESQLISTGKYLQNLLDTLKHKRENLQAFKDISYLMIITGMSSKDNAEAEYNYILSYKRANSLYNFWKEKIYVDFGEDYSKFIDLQISGVGTGGVGRDIIEEKNRSFFIQIIPKFNSIKLSNLDTKTDTVKQ